jgi:DNA-binding response OmpR family regulator
LRQKIEIEPTRPMLIKTESGIGYRFNLPRSSGFAEKAG